MADDHFPRLKLALQVVQTCGVAVAVAALILNFKAVRDQHDWNRRQQGFVLINQTNSQLRDMRPALVKAFPELVAKYAGQKLSRQDAETLFDACNPSTRVATGSGRTFTCEDRGTATTYLNLLELVAISFRNGVVDREIAESAYRGLLVEHYDFFEHFIDIAETRIRRKVWAPLQDAVLELRPKPTPSRQPTGT